MPSDTSTLPAPNLLRVHTTQTGLTLGWQSQKVSQWFIRREHGTKPWLTTDPLQTIARGDLTSHKDQELKAGQTYYISVIGVDANDKKSARSMRASTARASQSRG